MRKARNQLYNHPEYLFYLLSAAGTAGFVILCLLKGDGFDWISMGNTAKWSLTDFSRHVFFASDLNTVYETGETLACFPPLAYILFHLVYRMVPTPPGGYDWLSYVSSPYISIMYIMLLLLTVLAFAGLILKITGRSPGECMLCCGLLVCSLPFFMGAIERGNPVFLTLVIILAGLCLKDSPSAAGRECALLLLACAVNFKLYPAVLGLIYLKEKRWKEALRFVVYSVLLFFVPFIWTGGLSGLKAYFNNLSGLSSMTATEYSSFMHITFSILGRLGAGMGTAYAAGRIAGHICLIILLILAWITRVKWKELLFLSLIMSYYLPGNYRYTAVFMAIPLLFYMRDGNRDCGREDGRAVMELLYMYLFGLLFTVPSWIYPQRPELMMAFASMMLFAFSGGEESISRLRRRAS